MTAPEWLCDLFGWRSATAKSAARCRGLFDTEIAPNIADVGGVESLRIAGAVYDRLAIPRSRERGVLQDAGSPEASAGIELERGVEADLARILPTLDEQRSWLVTRKGTAASYAQFQHLAELQSLFEQNPTLRSALERGYQVKTDIHVGVERAGHRGPAFLHAAVSCKWSIRSDRVQNVRHEFATLVRNRRGRLPHLVLVTAEPLPSRLASIARGTGEVDAVYHLMFDEMAEAMTRDDVGADQKDQWRELVDQRRLKPYADLALDLVTS